MFLPAMDAHVKGESAPPHCQASYEPGKGRRCMILLQVPGKGKYILGKGIFSLVDTWTMSRIVEEMWLPSHVISQLSTCLTSLITEIYDP